METLQQELMTVKDDEVKRKEVSLKFVNKLEEYQKAEFSPDPYNYLAYCLEYITPDLPKKKRICIYCGGQQGMRWDPYSVKKGIAGSEEAVIYASKILANKGFEVSIYATPPDNSLYSVPNSNPRYIMASEFCNAKDFEIMIVWRSQMLNENVFNKAKYVYYWLHDMGMPDRPFMLPRNVNGVYFLSDYHRTTFPQLNNFSYCVAGNGIQLEHFSPYIGCTRDKHKCIYASNYGRGLLILLYIWEDVRKAIPTATLDIYYGRDTFGVMEPKALQDIIRIIDSLKDKGVREMGKVGHEELARAMSQASVWAYPCNNYAETFCITATKAQAAGMISVCSGNGALSETVDDESSFIVDGDYAKGETILKYKNTLIDVLKNIDKYNSLGYRDKARKFASHYTWDYVVNCWMTLHERIIEAQQQMLNQQL